LAEILRMHSVGKSIVNREYIFSHQRSTCS